VQDAINAAQASVASKEVWVAAGTYTGSGDEVGTITSAAQLYGGFAGTETERSERDVNVNITTLDGESVRRGVYIDADAIIDGFVITNGRETLGAGVFVNDGVVAVDNCTVTSCISVARGGGIYVSSGTFSMEFTLITACSAGDNGGGLYLSLPAVTITACDITQCTAAGNGGGAYFHRPSGVIEVCEFTLCSTTDASQNGGGIATSSFTTTMLVTGCTFTSCSTTKNGGGVYAANTHVTLSTFTSNTAGDTGGGIYVANSGSQTLNTFAGNVPNDVGP